MECWLSQVTTMARMVFNSNIMNELCSCKIYHVDDSLIDTHSLVLNKNEIVNFCSPVTVVYQITCFLMEFNWSMARDSSVTS